MNTVKKTIAACLATVMLVAFSGLAGAAYVGYTVQPGDIMWSIAQKLSVTLAELIAANPQIDSPASIYVGQSLYLPQQAGCR